MTSPSLFHFVRRALWQRGLLPAVSLVLLAYLNPCLAAVLPPDKPPADYRAEILNPDFITASQNPADASWLLAGTDASVWRITRSSPQQLQSTDASLAANSTSTISRIRFDASGSAAIAIGQNGLMLRSPDGGANWQRISLETDSDLRDLLHVAETNVWLAIGGRGVVLRSVDAGQSWSTHQLTPAFAAGRIQQTRDGRLWLLGERGLLAISSDSGKSWTHRQPGTNAAPIVGLYEQGAVLLASTGHGKLLRSANAGRDWQTIQTPSKGFVESMLFDEKHQRWVAVTHQGDRLWADAAGKTWRRSGAPGPAGITQIMWDAASERLLAVGYGGWVYSSADGGLSWQNSRLPGQPDLLGLGRDAQGFLAWGRYGAVYRLDNTGKTHAQNVLAWRALRHPQPETISALAWLPQSRTVLAAGLAGWMSRSQDIGKSWQKVDIKFVVDMYPTDFLALHALPDGQSALAAGPTGSVMRSADAGQSWQSVLNRPFESGEVLPTIVATGSSTWLVPEMRGPVYESNDQGQHWQRLNPPAGLDAEPVFRTGLASPFDGTVLLAGKGSHVLRRSWQAGEEVADWQAVALGQNHNIFALLADADSPNWWMAGAQGALLHSDNGAKSWQPLQIEGKPDVTSTLLSLIRFKSTSGELGKWLVAGRGGVIALSSDGKQWRQADSGNTQDLRLALHEPASGRVILVGRQGTVLRSSEDGLRWEKIHSATSADFKTALFLPDGSLLLAGDRLARLVPR